MIVPLEFYTPRSWMRGGRIQNAVADDCQKNEVFFCARPLLTPEGVNMSEEQGSWGIFSFLQPAFAPAPASEAAAPAATTEEKPDVSDPAPAKTPSITQTEIEAADPQKTIDTIRTLVGEGDDSGLVETCCKRLRVLCREPGPCKVCDEAGAAAAVVQAMMALPNAATVQLQALAALVNLCSGEANEHRTRAVDAGVMPAICNAMKTHPSNAEVTAMPHVPTPRSGRARAQLQSRALARSAGPRTLPAPRPRRPAQPLHARTHARTHAHTHEPPPLTATDLPASVDGAGAGDGDDRTAELLLRR
jgi:hypothetical protein